MFRPTPFIFAIARLVASSIAAIFTVAVFAADAPFELEDGDRVVFLGDTFIEREQYHGWVELMLTARFPERSITFRNLGWSGDTPAGDSRFGLSLLQAGKEPVDEGWNQLVKQIADAKPTVVFASYGMASSFDGEAGLSRFKADYLRLLAMIEENAPGARIILLAPLPHEQLGAPWPDAALHNEQLARYARTIGEIAAQRKARFVPLFDLLRADARRSNAGTTRDEAAGAATLTDNGIHPTGRGYRVIAEALEQQLFGQERAGAWRTSPQSEG
ncbi:MAG: SGNH/GDSL hydrolase family protein [Opitutaceae bacterium]